MHKPLQKLSWLKFIRGGGGTKPASIPKLDQNSDGLDSSPKSKKIHHKHELVES